jgi:RNA polymerase sigma factor (sigma-70 family)
MYSSQKDFLTQIEAHKGMIHKVCQVYCWNPGDREDLFQEIIIQLWKAWPGFRGESKFSTWLYRFEYGYIWSPQTKKSPGLHGTGKTTSGIK